MTCRIMRSALIAASMLITACGGGGGGGGGDGSPGPEPTGTVLVTRSIGVDGGAVEAGGLSLSVPPGAFGETVELSIVDTGGDAGFGSAALAPALRIDGLPAQFSQPLSLSLAFDAPLPSDAQMVIQLPGYNAHSGQVAQLNQFPETTMNGARLSASLAPPESTSTATARARSDVQFKQTADGEPVSLVSLGITGWSTLRSAPGHFAIHYPPGIGDGQAQNLAAALERAYARFLQADLGFSYAARSAFPVDVTLDVPKTGFLGADTFGAHIASRLSVNSAVMYFNSQLVEAGETLDATAGHEFFHLVQYLYDPRFQFAQGTAEPGHHWLNEATAAWVEGLFVDRADYVPEVTAESSNRLQPLEGYAATGSNAQSYGYGMAQYIEHLVRQAGPGLLVDTYEAIRGGGVTNATDPLGAISLNADAPLLDDFPEFIDAFLSGRLFPVVGPGEVVLLGNERRLTLDRADATADFLLADMPDLATRFAQVLIDDPDPPNALPDNLRLEASGLDPSDFLHVYSYRPPGPGNPDGLSALSLVASGYGAVVVPDIKALAAQDRRLLLALTRMRASAPYLDVRDTRLLIGARESSLDFSRVTRAQFDTRLLIDGERFDFDDFSSTRESISVANSGIATDAVAAPQDCPRIPGLPGVPYAFATETVSGNQTLRVSVTAIVDSLDCLTLIQGGVTFSVEQVDGLGQTSLLEELAVTVEDLPGSVIEVSDGTARVSYRISGLPTCDAVNAQGFDYYRFIASERSDFVGQSVLCAADNRFQLDLLIE